jgi:hypothetical protein
VSADLARSRVVPSIRLAAAIVGLAALIGIGAADLRSSAQSQGVVEPPRRGVPDTTDRILVFNDQIGMSGLSDAVVRFIADHYVGTQKLTRQESRRIRAFNPDFLVLHYRLGQALGHSMADDQCRPDGRTFVEIVRGDAWTREWPGDSDVRDEWFFRQDGRRVFNCSSGHFLADLDSTDWRSWWTDRLLADLALNENDGVFADSFSVPNYFGPRWNPALPALDTAFEAEWAGRMRRFTDFVRSRFAGRWLWIPNVGALINSRDPSNHTNADGVMIEAFAIPGDGSRYPPDDWVLQITRALSLVAADRIVIAQGYPKADDVDERVFLLASYLLIKGSRTFVNMDTGAEPEWFPEYGVSLGRPEAGGARAATDLYDPVSGVYRRRFASGTVLVNPGPEQRTVLLDQPEWLVRPVGGGIVPASGQPPGRLETLLVRQVTLEPGRAAILTTNPAR